LMLAYLGQGARLLNDPTLISNTFWNTQPSGVMYWVVFVLAILATIIASQAMISATFSIIYQAVNLNILPGLRMYHTSPTIRGQVYVPVANWLLCIATIAVAAAFQQSQNLTNAYGICVSGVMFVTDIMLVLVIIFVSPFHWVVAVIYFVVFGGVTATLLSSALLKFVTGGWFPITIAIVISIVMNIWRWGESVRKQKQRDIRLEDLLRCEDTSIGPHPNMHGEATSNLYNKVENKSVVRIPGCTLFYPSINTDFVPPIFYRFVESFNAVPQHVVFVHNRVVTVPYVPEESRVRIEPLAYMPGFYQVWVRNGYMDCAVRAQDIATSVQQLYNSAQVITFVAGRQEDTLFVRENVRIYACSGSNVVRRMILQGPFRWLSSMTRSVKIDAPHEKIQEISMRVVI